MNEILTVRAIEEVPSFYFPRGTQPYVKVIATSGRELTLPASECQGWGLGTKLRYSVTRLGDQETAELDDAYATIADLVEKGHALAAQLKSKATTQKVLAVSGAANIIALLWNLLT